METNASDSISPVPLVKRKRLTRQQRQQIVARFREGELTQKAFAAREGMSVTTLWNWLRQEQEASPAVVPSIRFEELTLPPASGSWAVEIVRPDHWTVRLAQNPESGVLKQLLQGLPC